MRGVIPKTGQCLLLLIAFAARVAFAAAVRNDYDHAVPHAAGLAILDALSSGQWEKLPLLAFGASIGVQNPPLAGYFWAGVAFFDRSPYSPTLLAGMMGVLACAMTLQLARRLMGDIAAMVAGALVAASPWSVFFGVGTWLQGQFEFQAICIAWLLFGGIATHSSKRVLASALLCAMFMQWYLASFGLGALLLMALGLCGKLVSGKVKIAAIVIISLSLGAFVVVILNTAASLSNLGSPRAPSAITDLSMHGYAHVARMTSGRGFEVNQLHEKYASVVRTTPAFQELLALSDARATVLDALLVFGGLLLVLGKVRGALASRLKWVLLAWMSIPPVIAMLLNIRDPSWLIHPHYMTITSPVTYLLAAAPFSLLQRRMPRAAAFVAPFVVILIVLSGLARVQLHVQYVREHPLLRSLEHLPLMEQQQIHASLSPLCDVLVTDQDPRWTASLWQDHASARPESETLGAFGNARSGHLFRYGTGARWCEFSMPQAPISYTSAITLSLMNGEEFIVHTQRPMPSLEPLDLSSNIGWHLTGALLPKRGKLGESLTLIERWRIDTLPDEPYASWYFAPFVKLFGQDGREILQVNSAPGLEGKDWRKDDILESVVQLTLPSDLPRGTYELRVSLFDPNQKKNAVYFDAAHPGEAIIELIRVLVVE